MDIQYNIVVTIINKTDGSTSKFTRRFDSSVTAASDSLLYNNNHLLSSRCYIPHLFSDEINAYCKACSINIDDVEIDEFEIVSLTDRVDVFFEDSEHKEELSLTPDIVAYIYPKNDALEVPALSGKAYDSHTIIWSWEDTEHAHYLIEEAVDPSIADSEDKIIAHLGIGVMSYVETGLEPDTSYTRRLISYTSEQTSLPSGSVTVTTETVEPVRSLEEYEVPRNYDFTTDDSQRDIIEERMDAFHSGIGDGNDLKVYKQMDADFYQKFKAYFEITGRRTQREKRYEQVGFNYKLCLEAKEIVESQDGEVTFDIDVYPREELTIRKYTYATKPVTIEAFAKATMFAYKPDSRTATLEINSYKPIMEKSVRNVEEQNWKDAIIVISLDCSTSMAHNLNSEHTDTRLTRAVKAAQKLIRKLSKASKNPSDTLRFHEPETDDGEWRITGGTPNLNKYILVFWATEATVIAKKNGDGKLIPLTAEDALTRLRIARTDSSKGIYVSRDGGERSHYKGNHVVKSGDNFEIESGIVKLAGNGIDSRTNFNKGLTAAKSIINEIKTNIHSLHSDINPEAYQVFITDGFCNRCTYKDSEGNNHTITCYGDNAYDKTEHSWRALRNKFLSHNNDNDSMDEGTDDFLNNITSSNDILSTNERRILNSIREGLKKDNNGCNGTFFMFAARWYKPDPSFSGRWPKPSTIKSGGSELIYEDARPTDSNWVSKGGASDYKKQRNFQHIIFRYIRAIYKKKYSDKWKDYICTSYALDETSAATGDNLAGSMMNICNFLSTLDVEIDEGDKLIGWALDDPEIKEIEYSIDTMVPIEIETEHLRFTFDDIIHKVIYDEKEKRAVISPDTFIKTGTFVGKSLYQMIYDKFLTSEEYAAGYTSLVTDESGSIIINGITIYDTYGYGDEDKRFDSVATLGKSGTVNVFADIDKAGTDSTFGDDTYLVNESSYLHITGYTDAIIYDNTQYITTELNAFDNPSIVIADSSSIGTLSNRKNPSIKLTDVSYSDLNVYIDVIEKDNDIVISAGDSIVVDAGDTIKLSELTSSVTASITTKYKSPVLNYRFSIEDPDARTSLYEILPKSNPESKFKNIVLLNIYYARNIFVGSGESYKKYISSYGSDPNATSSYPHYPYEEGFTKFTKKDWSDGVDTCKYIDEYIWFYADKSYKEQNYYDELPGNGIDSFYGLVNGRYRTDNITGKQDLVVDTPKFNIPTTIVDGSVKIYIVITELNPKDALVSYQWANPVSHDYNDITQTNGDYVTFSCDSITYKDVDYYDVLSTINMDNQEVYDNKTTEYIYELPKPSSVYDYKEYYLKVTTDNSDVIAMRYPNEISFDEETNIASVNCAFKGIVNSTSMWSPRIHNGYYYLNQHEYYAYSEFNVEADFCQVKENNYKTISGSVCINVSMRHLAGVTRRFDIQKGSRSSLLQDEKAFSWIDGKGLTLKPVIDGVYYKQYVTSTYYSPVIMFPEKLTTAIGFSVIYKFDDGSSYLPLYIRSYDLDNGIWGEWKSFTNYTAPDVPLSSAYQLKCDLQATCSDSVITVEDYLCCYLDWKDDCEESLCSNIETITDYICTGASETSGVYISKIYDYGCESTIMLNIYASNYALPCVVYVASSNNRNKLLAENIEWKNLMYDIDIHKETGRYFRYKIEIPEGEKVYWVHKIIETKKTSVILPYITDIIASGIHKPSDVVSSFTNIEAFEIPKDGTSHVIFNSVNDIIMADVLKRGYNETEVQNINISCTVEEIKLDYDEGIKEEYPVSSLGSSIAAQASLEYDIVVKDTPFIYVSKDDFGYDTITIKGTPQQYAPITVEDPEGHSYTRLYDVDYDLIIHEEYIMEENDKYIELSRNDYELNTLKVFLNGTEVSDSEYTRQNHLIIFNSLMKHGDKIEVSYNVPYSFFAEIDRKNNTTILHLHSTSEDTDEYDEDGTIIRKKLKVYFETNTKNNKFIANDLSFNPIYRTGYSGFVYLTDDHNEPYAINIYCNPTILSSGGYDSVDVSVEVLDILCNPVIHKEVAIDCDAGILECDNYITDMNGVIHFVYISSFTPCNATLKARVSLDDGTMLEKSITIINE